MLSKKVSKKGMNLLRALELRRLVDVLYDVQDVRIRTQNRLRQFPSETSKLYVTRLMKMEMDLQNQVEGMLNG